MNKLQLLLFCFIISLVSACAVSEEEKAADLQRHRDSVAAAEAMIRSAELANESRANALKSINQDALKNDSIIRKDSIFKAVKDTNAVVKTDSSSVKKPAPVKPKTEVKPAAKKTEQPKPTEKKKTTPSNTNGAKKAGQKK
jgi:outer membrane biosynthesis protein TonB